MRLSFNGVFSLVLVASTSMAGSKAQAEDSILGIAESIPEEFSTLVTALQLSGLARFFEQQWWCTLPGASAWKGCEPKTVLAPKNSAFESWPDEAKIALTKLLDPQYRPHLQDLLKYHVLDGEVDSTTAVSIAPVDVETLNGETIAVAVSGEALTINDVPVEEPFDVMATNGIIHSLGSVLLPTSATSTIADIAVGNVDFSILVQAAQRAGLVDVLADALANLTVFAPNNAAFEAIGGIDELTDDQLRDILLYHVSPGVQALPNIFWRDGIETLLGPNIEVSMGGRGHHDRRRLQEADDSSLRGHHGSGRGRLTLNGNTQVLAWNVLAANGAIHVIDSVLLLPPSIGEIASNDDRFTILTAALDATGLLETVNDPEAEITVFAPTDTAFEELGQDTINGLLEDTDTLRAILLLHVVDGVVRSSDLEESAVPTLNGQDVEIIFEYSHFLWQSWVESIFVKGGGNTDDDDLPEVIIPDINARNGVIHVVDKVILPS